MKFNAKQLEQIGDLSPTDIKAYLKTHDWELYQTYPEDDGSVWVKGDAHIRLLHDPDQYADYLPTIANLIKVVADIDKIPPDELIKTIKHGTVDCLKIHIPEPIASDGTVNIQRGIDAIENARNLLCAAAASTDDVLNKKIPRIIFPQKKSNMVSIYEKGLRLGQTEIGSYVITVEKDVQLTEDVNQSTLEEGPVLSFSRRVNLTLANAIKMLNDDYNNALDNPHSTLNIIQRTHRNGVSVNLCEALTNFGAVNENDYVPIEVEFSWAPKFPVPDDTPHSITIPGEQLRHYAEAAKYIRDTSESYEQDEQTFAGHVYALTRQDNANEGMITMKTTIDNKKISLHISLSAVGPNSDYDKAIRAHQSNKVIECVGVLAKSGTKYELSNPQKVRIL